MRVKFLITVTLLLLSAAMGSTGQAYVFTDDFSGGTINSSFWSYDNVNNLNQVSLDNERIVITQGNLGATGGVTFSASIPGDFVARVDYAILNPPASGYTYERIGLGASNIGPVERVSDYWFGGDVYLTHFTNSNVQPNPGINTTQLSGTLELRRDSSGISGYFYDGGATAQGNAVQIYKTNSFYTDPVSFGLSIWNGYTDASNGLRIAFDNFYLSAPSWEGPPGPGPNPVPEPATMLLLGAGLIGFAGYGRRKLS